MGNSSTKERSASPVDGGQGSSSRRHRHNGDPSSSSLPTLGRLNEGYSSRSRSRHNLESTLFGLGVGSNRETRERDREAEKQARELRRQERERERLKERERSLKEDRVDGGFLVTQGVYTGTEDFKDKIVRHFMIERRLAPFFKGLRDHEDDWTDAQLYAAVHDLPIPGPDAEPPKPTPKLTSKALGSSDNLTVPIASRSRAQSYTSEGSNRSNASTPSFGFSSTRSRSKTVSISSPKNPTLPTTTGPVESNDPSAFVDGRPIEAVMYKKAIECPICFMYYPPYLNKTRCCDQEICSECFVQIKRVDPHIPENHDNTPNPNANQPDTPSSIADQLVSEPACCPFCKQPELGVTYSPPPFRRGLYYAGSPGPASPFPLPGIENGGAFSNDSDGSLALSNPGSQPASPPQSPVGRRRLMLSVTSPEVVTTDHIRPDWSQKLATARSHAARRAAAATALHTAAFLMGNNSASGSGSGGYSRRLMRRARDNSNGDRGSESPSPNASGSGTPSGEGAATRGSLLALGSISSREREREREREAAGGPTVEQRLASLGFISPRDSSREATGGGLLNVGGSRSERRSRMVDLEEMMLMEAIRLSLAEEEERKAREDALLAKNRDQLQRQNSGERAEGKGKSVDRTHSDSGSAGSSASFASANERPPEVPENAGSADESMFNFRSLAAMITADEEEGKRDVEHVEDANHQHGHGVPVVGERVAPASGTMDAKGVAAVDVAVRHGAV
ncbi:hypothetical protein EDC01DRAFT_751610 [Geopyxis carbonaria]|nr:hypothetical protein EDC01DRAFT_751610 [Geopyxis carbonaria]